MMPLEKGKTYTSLELMGVIKGDVIYSAVEREVRNQIAKDIEEMRLTFNHDKNAGSVENCSRLPCIICVQVNRAAAIASGQK
jgi:hypothetical protein